jgi:hypothetical protein
MEMLQIGKTDSVKDYALNGDDMNSAMLDSFKPQKDQDSSGDDSGEKKESDDQ